MNNYSKQREIILDVIKQNPIHPTAEEIYQLVIKKDPRISKSTVYRNISILVEQGTIIKISLLSGPDRYDYLHQKHFHAICKKCGKVYDFCYKYDINEISKEIKAQTKINMDVDDIIAYGICEKCKSTNKNKEEL